MHMKDFFKYVTELPAGSGFAMFGSIHLTWLIVMSVFSIMMAVLYKNLPENDEECIDSNNSPINAGRNEGHVGIKHGKSHYDNNDREKFRIIIGVIMPLISIYRDAVLIITGHFDRYYLPLHLCGMALWIGALYCFTKWRFVGVVYVLLCVPGAASALIFPDWVDYPLWNYMHIHDFISHGLIVAWGICLLYSGEILPEWKELWMPVIFGLVGVIILTPVNKWLGTNYWFLSTPSAGSPLVFIMNIAGDKFYVAGYVLFVSAIIIIWLCAIKIIFNKKINN